MYATLVRPRTLISALLALLALVLTQVGIPRANAEEPLQCQVRVTPGAVNSYLGSQTFDIEFECNQDPTPGVSSNVDAELTLTPGETTGLVYQDGDIQPPPYRAGWYGLNAPCGTRVAVHVVTYDEDGPIDVGSGEVLLSCDVPPGDFDGDEWDDAHDNCVGIPNPDQADFDGDGQGDVCDNDADNDDVWNWNDDCPQTPPGTVVGSNGCVVPALQKCSVVDVWQVRVQRRTYLADYGWRFICPPGTTVQVQEGNSGSWLSDGRPTGSGGGSEDCGATVALRARDPYGRNVGEEAVRLLCGKARVTLNAKPEPLPRGKAMSAVGKAVLSNGKPLGVSVRVYFDPRGPKPAKLVGTDRTDRQGRYGLSFRPRKSGEVVARVADGRTFLGDSARDRIRVTRQGQAR